MLPIGAAGLLVLMAMVGSAVDLSRAYRAQQRLQAACDAGVLAGRRNVTSNGFNDAAQATAQRYFDNNFDPAKQESGVPVFNATTPDNGNTINATASATVDSAIMKIFGFAQFNLSASCAASMGVGNSDVTMVLDTTGSMEDPATGGASTSKLEDLQAAMKNFYATLRTATGSGNARIRYAFVPYSTTVNVGRLIHDVDRDYLTNVTPVQSATVITAPTSVSVFDSWGPARRVTRNPTVENYHETGGWAFYASDLYRKQSTCASNLPTVTWTNSGSSSTSTSSVVNSSGQQETTTSTRQPQTATVYACNTTYVNGNTRYIIQSAPAERDYVTYSNVTVQDPVYRNETQEKFHHWLYQQVNFDTSAYKNFTAVSYPLGYQGAMQSFTWPGCIEERRTTTDATFSYNSLTGISTGAESDLDIDSAPDTSNDATKWRPLMNGMAYYRKARHGDVVSDATSLYGSRASAACPYEARLLRTYDTQADFDAYADSLTPGGNTYHDLGIIWGGRLSSPDGMWSSLVNQAPANGGQVTRHLIFMTDGEMMPNSYTHSAYGIEWHDRRTTTTGNASTSRHNSRFLAVCEAVKAKGIRIWVIAFSSALTSQLTTCASPDSSFVATDADELNEAFQEIAIKVGELRVTQ